MMDLAETATTGAGVGSFSHFLDIRLLASEDVARRIVDQSFQQSA
jgi:hypothetical protein